MILNHIGIAMNGPEDIVINNINGSYEKLVDGF